MPDNETTTTAASTPRSIAGIWEVQHYLEFQGTNGWDTPVRVTEDSTFSTTNDDQTYEPSYLDRKIQPTFIMGRKVSIEFEVDAVLPGDIQAKLAACEDELNVPVRYTRTLAVDMETGEALASTARAAKRAEGVLTMKPFSGDAGSPVKLGGTVKLMSEYEYGTFNSSTSAFTAN